MPVASSTSDVYPIGGGDDFENTDYDSDSDAMPTDLVQVCPFSALFAAENY